MAKVSASEGLRPKSMETGVNGTDSSKDVYLEKRLGLTNAVAIIVGVIVGSGIFVSPTYTLRNAGSKGMALIVWVLSGGLTMIGALAYAELGTMIPKSGGDYAYIGEAFGPLPAFLYLWVALFILVPTANAITAIIFAQNIIMPFWPDCQPPKEAVTLIASLVICFLTAINCYNVKWVTRVQDSLTWAKMLALLVAFFAGVAYICKGHTENLQDMMQGTVTEPSKIAIAFYNGLFSYSGWNYLNFVTEELKEPFKNLPRAIYISIPVVTLVYVLTNFSLFAVLSTEEIFTSEAIAVTFGRKILGVMHWIMPCFVVLCALGSLNGAIYASSRIYFVGARNGHLPLAISLIDIRRRTPVPSVIFMGIMTLAMLLNSDPEKLIVYVTGVELIFILCSVAGLLWLRYKMPDAERPIRVHLSIPIVFLLTCITLVIFACFDKPDEIFVGLGLIVLGIPVYYIFVVWQNKPAWMINFCDSFNLFCSKMFLGIPENFDESNKSL